MKKFVWILLAICMVLGGAVGYASARSGAKGSGEPVALYDPENIAEPELPEETPAEPETAGEEEEKPADLRTIDFDALRAAYDADEVVGSVNGRDVTWGEYSYWLCNMGGQAQSYISTMAMYGQNVSWDDKLSADSEESFADYVVELAQDCVCELSGIETVIEEKGVELDAEDEAALAEKLTEDIAANCGEGATEEDFEAYLLENNETREMYDRMSRATLLMQKTFNTLYGEKGEKVSEEDAIAFLRDNDYLCASHILFLTLDMSTYEALDEETVAQKLQQAEAVSAELRAIEDVNERVKRFAELKQQYCEDSGKDVFPDGYLFPSGTMVEEFENGTLALGEYEVSEPVLSGYGYHVIMRLPLSAEMTVYSAEGDARYLCASEQYNAMMTGSIDGSVLTLNDKFAAFDLTAFLA